MKQNINKRISELTEKLLHLTNKEQNTMFFFYLFCASAIIFYLVCMKLTLPIILTVIVSIVLYGEARRFKSKMKIVTDQISFLCALDAELPEGY